MNESILDEILLVLKNYSFIRNEILCCTVDYKTEISSYINDKRFDQVGSYNYQSYEDMIADLQNVRMRQFQDFSDYYGMLSTRKIYEIDRKIDEYKTSTEEDYKIGHELEITQIIIELIDSYIEVLNNFPMEHLPYETDSYKKYSSILQRNNYPAETLVKIRRNLVI
jgi:hypothetical protein